jgi:hypothetical protein
MIHHEAKGKKQTARAILVPLLLLVLVPAIAGAAAVQRTAVTASDDWPLASYLDLGNLRCSGGDLSWANPVTPVCSSSGQIHLRDAVAYSCVAAKTADGSQEPRFSGVLVSTFNGNLRADYSGSVWGSWQLVPGDTCDPGNLTDPESVWTGTWRGRRTLDCGDGPCRWIGALKMVAKGHGGDIEGLHFKGKETVVTFTPMPLAYEALPGFCPGCPPEGQVTGTIKGR